jgi:hypothetical protein
MAPLSSCSNNPPMILTQLNTGNAWCSIDHCFTLMQLKNWYAFCTRNNVLPQQRSRYWTTGINHHLPVGESPLVSIEHRCLSFVLRLHTYISVCIASAAGRLKCTSDYRRGLDWFIGFINTLQVITTNNCNSILDFNTTNYSTLKSPHSVSTRLHLVTALHKGYSSAVSSLDVSW